MNEKNWSWQRVKIKNHVKKIDRKKIWSLQRVEITCKNYENVDWRSDCPCFDLHAHNNMEQCDKCNVFNDIYLLVHEFT